MLSKKLMFCLLAFYSVSSISATCNQCQSNFAYCTNETHFYLCIDGSTPSISGTPAKCPDGTFCTNSPNICAAEDCDQEVSISCPNAASSDDCNNCDLRQLTCVSRTQFAICINGNPAAITSCDEGELCSTGLFDDPSSSKICAPAEVLDFLGYTATCNNAAADVVTTPAPVTTTSSPARLQTQCMNAQVASSNRFYYIRNVDDATCRSYIYCERMGSQIVAVSFTCKTGYYDTTTRKCVADKPANCTA